VNVETIDIRLRVSSPEAIALPWESPLADWDPMWIPFCDVPVGPSRHLVRFVEVPDGLLAIKEAPDRIVEREYAVLRRLEQQRLPAVRALGVVLRGAERDGLLVTRFLTHSWQFFMRLPATSTRQRDRLLQALAGLLVELHRHGVFWGDGSLANTLFVRSGQLLEAHLVDAETSAIHPSLSDGQRRHDLEILVENVAGGLVDIASRAGPVADIEPHVLAAESLATTYEELWNQLHAGLEIRRDERWRIASHLHRLHDLGYAIDEVRIERGANGGDLLQVTVCVAGRNHHAEQLQALTGIAAREGQAAILLHDLRAYAHSATPPMDLPTAAPRWRTTVFEPGLARVADLTRYTDPIQALCDLLEVRWLLSEQAGRDVGDDTALAALRSRDLPPDAAAAMSVLETPTAEYRLER
jgi:hypothetical protein